MRFRSLLFGGFLVAALSLPAQEDEGAIYFSLRQDRPVRPGEVASVQLHANGLDEIQFRLYRVNEPLTFIENLPDLHQFGGGVRKTPKDLTLLEKFHAWKLELRAKLRDIARAQFTQEHRADIRNRMIASEQKVVEPGMAGTGYAAVPILNPQQLVRTWVQPLQEHRRWEGLTVPVTIADKGLYVLEATDGKKRAYTLISVTELALLTKTMPGKILARIVDRMSGAPVTDCPVALIDPAKKGTPLQVRTDGDGLATLEQADSGEENMAVVAFPKGDFAISAIGAWNLRNADNRPLSGVVYTDRPVYRPGHTVQFKAIVRSEDQNFYQLPTERELNVHVEDGDGQQLYDKKLPVSAYGTVNGSLEIPAAAALGYYNVRVGGEAHALYGGFHVEEYRKPEYEVKVTPAQRRGLQGQPNKITVEAKYYYGEPVKKAKAVVAVYKGRWWRPWQMEEGESEGEEGEEGASYGMEQVTQQEAELDDNGRYTLDLAVDYAEFDQQYRVEARVTDAGNREIAGSGWFVATQGPFYLDLRPESWVGSEGKPARMHLEARDYDGKPVANVTASLEVSWWTWRNGEQKTSVVTTLNVTTDAQGVATPEFTPAEAGTYKVKASARTPNGAMVTDDAYVWVSGTGGWENDSRERIQIVPDKKSYQAGETAHVLMVTGRPNTELWVSIEGRSFHKGQFVHAKDASVMVDFSIEGNYTPNVFVEAVFVKDNKLFRGSKSLKVPPVERALKVEVTSPKSEFKPGESALYTVEAHDNAGKPVQAEFSLGLVDEAIYAIEKDPTPDLVSVFYGRVYNRVSTDSSFYYYFYGEAGTRKMQLAELRPPSWRAQLKPERMVEPKIRKLFPDTMYWVADMKTGADGRARARVTFPDALTMWRATARGVTPDTKVGSAVQRSVVRKNLLLAMGTPRFFTEGDEMVVPLIVRNYLATDKQVRVTLDAKGVEVMDAGARTVTVPSKGEAKVEYRLRARTDRQAVLTGKALTDEESDGVELTIPVEWAGVRMSEARAGALKDASSPSAKVQLAFPAGHRPATRELSITLTPSVAGTLFAALEYLTSYPYGCVEQTMSSFLPNVVVTRAMKELNVPASVNAGELKKKVADGFQRLYSMQHEDGGWGWWTWDETHPFMTAYVTAGLIDAKDAGYKVDEERISNAKASLIKQFDKMKSDNEDLPAYMVYALARAGGDAKPRFDKAYANRSAMTGYGLALLGLAARQLGDARADGIASELEAKVQRTGDEAFWHVERDPLLDFPFDVSPEATAFALKFLANQKPTSALLEPAALWLINHRDQGYYWASTKQTAMVIYGLTDFLKRSGELEPNYTVTLTVNGKQRLTKRITAAEALSTTPAKLVLGPNDTTDTNSIEITRNGTGRVYWSARADAFVPGAQSIVRGKLPTITREYFLLTPLQEQGKITYKMTPLSSTVQTGDLVAARLTIKGAEGHYLLIEDPIPAGTELVENEGRFEFKDRVPWWAQWSDRRELRDNRAVYFERYFGARDERVYSHLMKVTHAGKFAVSPARIIPMYEPGSISTTEARQLEVRPQ